MRGPSSFINWYAKAVVVASFEEVKCCQLGRHPESQTGATIGAT